MKRRSFLQLIGGAAGLTVAGGLIRSNSAYAADDTKVLKIGYQKSAVGLILGKESGNLERRLKEYGFGVSWHEFVSGPPMMEALNVGSIHLAMTGDMPPIFAQAAGAKLVYAGYEPAKPDSSAILVLKDSPLKDIASLQGKRIGFEKGSSAHNLTISALEKAGIPLKDVTFAFLSPADGQAAFRNGAIDAWAIWDPFYALAETAIPVRALTTGRGLVANYTFYLAASDFAEKQAPILGAVFEELAKNQAWRERNIDEVSAVLARWANIDKAVYDLALSRRPDLTVKPVPDSVLAEQQAIADTFYKHGILPKPIVIREASWVRT